MLIDLLQYDLLDLILAHAWTEEEQVEILARYNEGCNLYLSEKLTPYFDDKTEIAFAQLQKNPDLTEEKVIAFYKQQIPNLQNVLEQFLLYFKRTFLLRLYENIVNQLKQSNQNQQELALWEEILRAAQKDEWQVVIKYLKRI